MSKEGYAVMCKKTYVVIGVSKADPHMGGDIDEDCIFSNMEDAVAMCEKLNKEYETSSWFSVSEIDLSNAKEDTNK